jgi:hypothetical protein
MSTVVLKHRPIDWKKFETKLWYAIRIALSDLEGVENQPKLYQVNMCTFHNQIQRKCAVCFAGSGMTRKVARTKVVTPY